MQRSNKIDRRVATSRSGFTLIEVMVALGILAFGVLSATAGQIAAITLSSDSRNHTVAMSLAQQQLEVFRAMPPADVLALVGLPLDPLNPIDPDPGDGTAMAFVRRWLIQADTPEVGVMTVTVEVDWINALGSVRTARVESLKANS